MGSQRHRRVRAGRARCRPARSVQGPQGAATGAAVRIRRASSSSTSATTRRPQVAALASKQVDMLYQGATSPARDDREAAASCRCNRSTRPIRRWRASSSIKPFDDKRVRQALRYAIDSEAVLKVAHRGLGQRRRASSRRAGPSRIRQCRLHEAGHRQGEGAAGRSRLPERHRRGDHLPAAARTGSCSPCRPWWSNGRRPASASRST